MPDPTARQVTQTALESLAAVIPFAVYVAALDDDAILFANDAFSTVFRAVGSARGTPARSLFCDVAHCDDMRARIESAGAIAPEVACLRRGDGSEFWALVSSTVVELDGRPARLTSVIDVDESRRDARRLADSERLLERVFDTIPQPLSVKDADGRYARVNPTFARYVGVEPERLVGTRPGDVGIVRPEIAQILDEDRRLLGGEVEEIRAEVRRTTSSGEVVIDLCKSALLDEDGAVVGIVDVGIDVTERANAERELGRHRDRLEEMVRARTAELEEADRELVRSERLAAVGKVIGTVSHELRNPIGTLQMTFATLRAHLAGDPALDRPVERMERNIRRCATIIQELLDYSRSREPELVDTALDEWIGHVVEDQHVPPEVSLELDLGCPGRTVPVDRLRLTQAITNVMNNAVQALAEDARPVAPRIVLATRAAPGGLVIEVTDNGPGIPAELGERVFEPLFSTRSGGVGLGLPLVRQVLDEHGGRVEVDSSGAGTTIRLHLPGAPSNEETKRE